MDDAEGAAQPQAEGRQAGGEGGSAPQPATPDVPPEAGAEPRVDPAAAGDQGAGEAGVVVATPDEARAKNYVPYEDRFKPVLQERNELRRKLEELKAQTDLLARLRAGEERPPDSGSGAEEVDPDDPFSIAKAARREAEELRQRLDRREADERTAREAAMVNATIDDLARRLGFKDASAASVDIRKEVVYALHSTGKQPDVEAVARSLRQREIDAERAMIDRYKGTKQSPEARAAATTPPSPPVVTSPPERKLSGVGSRGALDRVLSRLRGQGA